MEDSNHATAMAKWNLQGCPKFEKFTFENFKKFWNHNGKDIHGRMRVNLLPTDLDEFESCHNWVQWVFPTMEESRFNNLAPVLEENDVKELDCKMVIRHLELVMPFFGWNVSRGGSFSLTDNAESMTANWLTPGNHNHLRLTRIMKSLRYFGHQKYAQNLFTEILCPVYESYNSVGAKFKELGIAVPVDYETYTYWYEGAFGHKPILP